MGANILEGWNNPPGESRGTYLVLPEEDVMISICIDIPMSLIAYF
jgi:hypothetical protein